MINYIKVTADNLDEAREACAACNQRDDLQVGDETWGILCDGQRGQMSRYACGRGAVSFNGDSLWGDWTTTGDLKLLVLDDNETHVDEQGNAMTIGEMQDAIRLIEIESN